MKRPASRLRGDPEVVAHLNEYLSYELTGHRQYLIHAGMCRHWGFERLAKLQDAYWAEEVQHAAKIIAHILMLGAPRHRANCGRSPALPRCPSSWRSIARW